MFSYIHQTEIPFNHKMSKSTTMTVSSNLQLYKSKSLINFFLKCSKPIAEVKPTTTSAAVQPLTERRRSVGSHLKKHEKRPNEIGVNFTPFNEPQKALQLVSIQLNSSEWQV